MKKETKRYTSNNINDTDGFPVFSSEKERLSYMRQEYGQYGIADAFNAFYNVKNNSNKNAEACADDIAITDMTLGSIVELHVMNWTDDRIEFSAPGVKNEIVSYERFNKSNVHFQQYLTMHSNKLRAEVREFKRGKYVVSVLNGYYRMWKEAIERDCINNGHAIRLHVDTLTKGGLLCSTPIYTIQELTGENYTARCFVPGSQTTLGIETDFDRWVGQDIIAVPQKFGTFRSGTGAPIEDSIICSRKRALQKVGESNLYDIYNCFMLSDKHDNNSFVYTGKVSGIINSNKKTGVFIEIDDKCIVGMLPVSADNLVDYMPGDTVKVRITGFDTQYGKEPFVVKNNRIVQCSTKPLFELV